MRKNKDILAQNLENLKSRLKSHGVENVKLFTMSPHARAYLDQIESGDRKLRPILDGSKKYIDNSRLLKKTIDVLGYEVVNKGNDAPRGGKTGDFWVISKKNCV